MGPILRQLDVVNAFTLSGLFFSFAVMMFAMQGQFYMAAICMVFSGLVDLFDGFLAKHLSRTDGAKAMGKELDSLVDMCAFGFAPAIFAYCFGLKGGLSIALLIGYMGVNALRLGYFNSTGFQQESGADYYTGMPVTYAALFIPLVFTVRLFLPDETVERVLFLLYALLSVAMVSNIRVLKLRGIWYGIFGVGAVILVGVYVRAILASLG